MEIVKRWALPAIQAVISIVLLFMVISSGLLPAKYLWIAIAAVILLMAVTVLLAHSRSGATRSLGSILAIFMSGMLVFAMVYVQHIMKTLEGEYQKTFARKLTLCKHQLSEPALRNTRVCAHKTHYPVLYPLEITVIGLNFSSVLTAGL